MGSGTKKLFLIVAVLLVGLISGCGGGGEGAFDEGDNISTAPTVNSVYPANGTTNIATLPTITVTFSQVMDQTATANAFSMSPSVSNADIFWSEDGKTMIVIPATALSTSTTYTCTVGTGAMNSSGNALASMYSWSWTTGSADIISPTVLSVEPKNNAEDVLPSSIITVIFSEAMDRTSVEGAFSIDPSVTGTINWTTNNIMTFIPDSNLTSNNTYTCTVGTGATDNTGNSLASAYLWSWTTLSSSDATAPTITSVTPLNSATSVATSSAISVEFSEAMNHTSAQVAFSMSSSGGTEVTGTFGWSGNIMTFTPDSSLSANTQYICVVDIGATDSVGNALESIYEWSFTTVDTIAPTATSVTPLGGSTGVATLPTITIEFSEKMNQASVEGAFLISPSIAGNFSWNVDGTVMTFIPATLTEDTLYTCTVGTGATDLAGNNLVPAYSWNWRTRNAPDTTAPTILFVNPVVNAVNVATSSAISVEFSEAMDHSSAESAFSISGGVLGSFSWDGNTMTFTPTSALSINTLYTCTVGTGATDSVGNPLASAYTWSFTTHDTIAPYIVSVNPFNGATGLSRSRTTTKVIVTFSEPMSKVSAQTAFSIRQYSPKYSYHAENFSWDSTGTVMTYTYKRPTAHKTWSASTTYLCTVGTRATDVAGNHLNPAPYTWSWKTGTGI